MVVGADGNKTEAVEISQFWAEELKSMPFLSSKCNIVNKFLICVFFIQRKVARRCSC